MEKFLIPEGTRDLIFDECEIKELLLSRSADVLSNFGYKEVITPTIEYYNTFNIDDSGLGEEDIYKFFDNKGRILVLRPDMTVPISRVVSTKLKDAELPLKIRYTSNVFRVNESLGGKRNEYTDCGVELIGSEERQGDLEILVTALDLLTKLEVSDFKLEIGNINLFKEATKDLNISREKEKQLAELIERKSLKALEDFLNDLDITSQQKEFFLKLPWMFGDKDVIGIVKNVAFNDGIKESLCKLEDIYDVLTELGYKNCISFDLGMAPRLNYYTGIIFRGYVSGVGSPVLSGGRYDNLFNNFGEELKAIGFSINIDLLIESTKIKGPQKIVYNINYNSKNLIDAFKEANRLREENNIVNLIADDEISDVIIKREERK